MEKLLKLASQVADQADVYYQEDSTDRIEFVDGKLEKADTSLSYGMALRVIKDGKVGLAHTCNLLDPQALTDQAVTSAANGMAVNIKLPFTKDLPKVEGYDPSIEKMDKKELIAEGERLVQYVKTRSQGQFNLDYGYSTSRMGIMNSAGTDLSQKDSTFWVYGQMIFPGTGSGLFEFRTGKGYVPLTEAMLDEMLELFRISENQIVPPTGALPVIFTDMTLSALLSRFFTAASPVNIYNKVSPLCDRYGEKIFSEKISIRQDPFDPELSISTFDSEGTPTQRMDYVEKGVFKAIPTDLNYAQKLGLEPTGNGFRPSFEYQPSAQPFNLSLETGAQSMKEMIASLDKGIIVQSLMGAHSGNILNGDYSVGVSTGFYIEKGVILGRVKDCMLSGNAYDTLSKVTEVESIAHNLGSRKFPGILCDGISVTGK